MRIVGKRQNNIIDRCVVCNEELQWFKGCVIYNTEDAHIFREDDWLALREMKYLRAEHKHNSLWLFIKMIESKNIYGWSAYKGWEQIVYMGEAVQIVEEI